MKRIFFLLLFVVGCSSTSSSPTIADGSTDAGVDGGDAGPCTLPARPYWSSPGCDAAPTCIEEFLADAPGPSDLLCGCDGVTRPGGPPSSVPYTHVGACEGADATPPVDAADAPSEAGD